MKNSTIPMVSFVKRETEVPNDVLTEILVKLPIRTCLRCKCVCKLWYNLIVSTDFIVKHQTDFNNNGSKNRKKSEFSISCDSCVPNGTSTTVSIRFFDIPVYLTIPVLVDRIEVVGCSNGLICLSLSLQQEGFIIWNPVTKQCRQISGHYPSYKKGYYSCGFCFNPVENIFKVARLAIPFTERHVNDSEVNIFTSKSNTWSSQELPLSHSIDFRKDFVCVGTRMYWEAMPSGDGGVLKILYFDMVDESFSSIMVLSFKAGRTNLKLWSYEGSLAFFAGRCTGSISPAYYFEVWTVKNYGADKFILSKRIVSRRSVNAAFLNGIMCKGERNYFVVTNESGEQFLCNPKTGKTKDLVGTKKLAPNCCTYSESFASVY